MGHSYILAVLTMAIPILLLTPEGSLANTGAILEEITVTARKRPEPLQDAPLAITAFDHNEIEQQQIDDVYRISQLAPGFSLSNYNKATPQFYIRGIGSNTSGAADDPSVSLFVDDVYIARAGFFDSDFFSLQSIAVLRGPQGTLYGKNAIGGVVQVSTLAPSSEANGKLHITLGDRQQQDWQLYVNGPLTRHSSANFAFSSRRQDGYVDNTQTQIAERDQDSLAGRGQWLWQKGPLQLRLGLDQQQLNLAGNGRTLANEALFGLLDTPSRNQHRQTDSPVAGFTHSQDRGISLKTSYTPGLLAWHSITAARDSNYQFADEILPLIAAPTLQNRVDENARQFSQELRLNNTDAGRHSWVLGAYFLREHVQRQEDFDSRGLTMLLTGLSIESANNQFDATNTTSSTAIFGDYSWYLNPLWSIGVGARYTSERKQFNTSASGTDPIGLGFIINAYADVDEQQRWHNLSPRANVQFQPKYGDQNIYFSITDGFKSGAYNSLASTAAAARHPVNQETARQWELGYKSYWLEQTLRFNATGFYIDYKDLQVFQVNNGVQLVENAASARIQGLELELQSRPLYAWELSANYSYLHARYREFSSASGQDFSDNHLTRAPEHSGSVSIAYFMAQPHGDISLRLNYHYQDVMFFNASNTALTQADSYQLWHLQAQYERTDKSWALRWWANNLLDEKYHLFIVPISTTQSRIPGEPRSFGISGHYRLF